MNRLTPQGRAAARRAAIAAGTLPDVSRDAREIPVKLAVRVEDGAKAPDDLGTRQRGVQGEITEARRILDAAMSEQDLQTLVIDLATKTGWVIHHQIVPFRIINGRHIAITESGTDKGFPDLVLIHPARQLVWFRELKTMTGKLSADQERWRDAIIATGGDWRLWRPCHWQSIEMGLKGEFA